MTFTIPQDDIARVQAKFRAGQTLPVEAFNRDFATKLATGKLLAIDNQVDVTTGTVRLKAIFDNVDNLLFPNQFVNARLLVDVREGAVVVPTAAVQHGPESDFVYVVKSDDTVDRRDIQVGPTEGDQTAIDSGLTVGEIVVTGGVDKLQPGAKIAAQERKPGRKGGQGGPKASPADAGDAKSPPAAAGAAPEPAAAPGTGEKASPAAQPAPDAAEVQPAK
jgi:multidrug efflux system membrane fusion protein